MVHYQSVSQEAEESTDRLYQLAFEAGLGPNSSLIEIAYAVFAPNKATLVEKYIKLGNIVYLEKEIFPDTNDGVTLGDFISDSSQNLEEEIVSTISEEELIAICVKVLTPRELKVIKMRFGLEGNLNHTLEEVGKEFEVTRERIRQIQLKAINKLGRDPQLRRIFKENLR